MSYQSVNEFRLYSLTSGSFSNVPDSIIQTFLDEAKNEIDGSLYPHHTLPLTSASVAPAYPPLVTECERTIAAYRLWLMLGLNPGTGTALLEKRYQEIVGDPLNPQSGILGQWRYGHLVLIDAVDNVAPTKPKFQVTGQPPRSWQQGTSIRKGQKIY